jgi:hypothetical protein
VKLTIAFITGRSEPHLDWLLSSLASQLVADDEIEVLVIDLRARTPEQLGSSARPLRNVRVRVEPPKPSPWQGPHRVTSRDWWAKSSAMNTAFVLCETEYVAFTDDCCKLGPEWMKTVRRGDQRRRSVLAGTYDKIVGGVVTRDHRRSSARDGRKNCGGGWLYGCTFALPLDWALDVNGAEEGCDGMGAEDYIFGLMLENRGHRIDFVPSLAVVQQRIEISMPNDVHAGLRRIDKGTSPNDKSHAALQRFGLRALTEFTPDLRKLRADRAAGKLLWPEVDRDLRDWYDGQLVREMV